MFIKSRNKPKYMKTLLHIIVFNISFKHRKKVTYQADTTFQELINRRYQTRC
jgi:hypothetical protein